jgi:hypothetical protein
MRLPVIPFPEPVYMITVSGGPVRSRRVTAQALRVALWGIPAAVVELALILAGHGRHALWLTLAATYVTLAIAVLTVNTRPGSEKEAS